MVNNEIKVEMKKYLKIWKWKQKDPKSTGHSRNSSKRKVHSNKGLFQEIRKISNKQLNLAPKATIERITNKTQS